MEPATLAPPPAPSLEVAPDGPSEQLLLEPRAPPLPQGAAVYAHPRTQACGMGR